MRYRPGPMYVISIALAATLALAGCASTGVGTATGTQPPQPPITQVAAIVPTEALGTMATSSPTNTLPPALEPAETKRPTRTPKPSATPTSTRTPVPTATVYPAPAVPLSPAGPWLIFWADEHLWAINQDGTGLTRLTNEHVYASAVCPTSTVQSGLTIAYTAREYDKTLIKLLSWPGGNVKTIVYSLTKGVGALEWSPSGNKLAFVSAIGDVSADRFVSDVFVYDVATEQTTRIAATSSNSLVGWSPDERFVIHQSLYADMGGRGTGAVWSSRADAGGVTHLVDALDNQRIPGDVEYLGWLSSTEIIATFDQWIMGENVMNRDIRTINIETGDYTTLVREPLLDVAYSSEHNLFLMTKEVAPSPNRLLIFYHNGERREVAGYTIKHVEWLSTYDMFLGHTPDGHAYLITPDGVVTEIPTPEWSMYDPHSVNYHSVIVSPDHQWWAWHHSRSTGGDLAGSELWVGPAMSQPSVSLSLATYPTTFDFVISRGNVIWSPDSQYLLWSSRRGIFVARPPGFEAALVAKLPDYSYLPGAVWVK